MLTHPCLPALSVYLLAVRVIPEIISDLQRIILYYTWLNQNLKYLAVRATCCLLSLVYTEEVAGGRNKGAAQEGRWGRGSESASFLHKFCACATAAAF